jgi:hypothetical protein
LLGKAPFAPASPDLPACELSSALLSSQEVLQVQQHRTLDCKEKSAIFRSRTLLLIFVIPLLILVIACGGDKKDDAATSTGSAGGAGSTGTSSSSPSSNASGEDRAVSLENCTQYASLAAAATSAFTPSTAGSLKLDKNALNNVVKAAPGEIRGDMQVIVDALVAYIEAIEKIGINLSDPSSFARLDEAKLQQFQSATDKLDDEKVRTASDKVDAYFASKCR